MSTPDSTKAAARSWLRRDDKFKALSDGEISTQMIERVWAKIPLGSYEECLIDEFISRFDRMAKVERDGQGSVLKGTK